MGQDGCRFLVRQYLSTEATLPGPCTINTIPRQEVHRHRAERKRDGLDKQQGLGVVPKRVDKPDREKDRLKVITKQVVIRLFSVDRKGRAWTVFQIAWSQMPRS